MTSPTAYRPGDVVIKGANAVNPEKCRQRYISGIRSRHNNTRVTGCDWKAGRVLYPGGT